MVTLQPNKRIDLSDVACNNPTGLAIAAQTTLKRQLQCVMDQLPLAALHSDETRENVHQLRVATRRALATIDLYSTLISKKEAHWIRDQLKHIRKACGKARDLDVFDRAVRVIQAPKTSNARSSANETTRQGTTANHETSSSTD